MRRLTAAFVLFLSAASTAGAQTRSREQRTAACIEGIGERAGALAARDWEGLSRLSRRDRQNCVGLLGKTSETQIFELLALAAFESRNWKTALLSAQACTSFNYLSYSCHIHELQSLFELKRLPETERKLEMTDKLLAHLKESIASKLKEATSAYDLELLDIERQKLDLAIATLDLIRIKLLPSN